MNGLALASSTIAIAIVAVLFLVFLVLLAASFIRARRSQRQLASVAERPAAAPRVGGVGTPAVATAGGGGAPKAPKPISRRDFFRAGLLGSVMVFGAQFGAATLAFLWPNLKGGFGSVIAAGSLEEIKGYIEQNRQPFYYGAGRFYITTYNGEGTDTVYEGITQEGLMALYQKCVHLGCRVPFCQASQWFECPCHGSKYNHAGEYELGPAPRGLDRFALTVQGGQVNVDTSQVVPGPPRGTDTLNQAPEGPFCVGGQA